MLYHSLLRGHDGVVYSWSIIAAAHQTKANILTPYYVPGTLHSVPVTHSVLCDTLGQQSGVDPDGGSGDIEDPRDLLHRQAAHLLLCLVPHHLVIPGPAHHHSQQSSVTLGIDQSEASIQVT